MRIRAIIAGIQDFLFDAGNNKQEALTTVTQERGKNTVEINKINIHTIPAIGRFGYSGFQSIADYIDRNNNTVPKLPKWDAETAYKVGHMLLHNRQVIVCLRACKNKLPKDNPSFWLRLKAD